MDRAERKRHKDAGWKVSSTADFLGLTKEESVYIDLRVRLVEALKARRQAAKLSQKAFAIAMRSSQSRIAKAEANHSSVSLDLLIRSLIALGVNLNELGRILDVKQSDRRISSTSQRTKHKPAKQAVKNSRKNSVKAA
jgi:transcriptional regulator with XRE-family HTH domain